MQTTNWRVGDVIPVRHIWREVVWYAHPATVIEDTLERLVIFEPAGARRQWSHFDFESGRIEPPREQQRHSTDALIIMEAGAGHCRRSRPPLEVERRRSIGADASARLDHGR